MYMYIYIDIILYNYLYTSLILVICVYILCCYRWLQMYIYNINFVDIAKKIKTRSSNKSLYLN